MSEEQLKAFLEKVKDDTELQEKFNGAADTDAVLAIAKEAGFIISADDLKTQSEISDAELERVAGGCANGIVTECSGFDQCSKYIPTLNIEKILQGR